MISSVHFECVKLKIKKIKSIYFSRRFPQDRNQDHRHVTAYHPSKTPALKYITTIQQSYCYHVNLLQQLGHLLERTATN